MRLLEVLRMKCSVRALQRVRLRWLLHEVRLVLWLLLQHICMCWTVGSKRGQSLGLISQSGCHARVLMQATWVAEHVRVRLGPHWLRHHGLVLALVNMSVEVRLILCLALWAKLSWLLSYCGTKARDLWLSCRLYLLLGCEVESLGLRRLRLSIGRHATCSCLIARHLCSLGMNALRCCTELADLRVDTRIPTWDWLYALTDLGALLCRLTCLHDAVFSIALSPLDVTTAAANIATERHASKGGVPSTLRCLLLRPMVLLCCLCLANVYVGLHFALVRSLEPTRACNLIATMTLLVILFVLIIILRCPILIQTKSVSTWRSRLDLSLLVHGLVLTCVGCILNHSLGLLRHFTFFNMRGPSRIARQILVLI